MTTTIENAGAGDVIFNADRSLMFVSHKNAGVITVYNALTGLLVRTLNVGNQLGGMDISSDGSFLLVTERVAVSRNGNDGTFAIHKVDLATGAVTSYTHSLFSLGAPFHDLAILEDGTAIVSHDFNGSGRTDIYRLNTTTGQFTYLTGDAPQNPIVTAAADRNSVLVSSGLNNSGVGRVIELSEQGAVAIAASSGGPVNDFFDPSLHAISPNGNIVIQRSYSGGVDVFDGRFTFLAHLPNVGNGSFGIKSALSFDATGEYLYELRTWTPTAVSIVKISTANWQTVSEINLTQSLSNDNASFGTNRDSFGNIFSVDPDGQYFIVRTFGGVYRIDNPEAVTPTQGDASANMITGTNGRDVLYGNDGNDILYGGEGTDALRGGSGGDIIDGGAGADTMYGGDGDDVYYVDNIADRAVETTANAGYDEVRSSASFDLEGGIETLTLTGAAAIDGTGNNEANVIVGNDAANKLAGMGGNDLLLGGLGNDILVGGTGVDEMRGGAGADTYYVDQLTDLAIELPGEGIDTVFASFNNYVLGAELENLTLVAGSVATTATGNGLANRITGNARDNILIGGLGADILDGSTGFDSASYIDSAGGVTVNLALNTGSGHSAEGDTYLSIENLRGSSFADVLIGNGGGNALFGLDGDDSLDGGVGVDYLIGGTGADQMNGGVGNDFLYVDNSGDTALGGDGIDTVLFGATLDHVAAADVEQFANQSTGNIIAMLNALDNRYDGGVGADIVLAGGGIDTLAGLAGEDGLFGEGGDDVIDGGAGQDKLDGGIGNDSVSGGDDGGTLRGGEGDDVLDGGAGSDALTGGTGVDIFTGGEGRDKFRFGNGDTGNTIATADRITDLDQAQGERISLTAMDAIFGGADDAFTFIGTSAFGNVAGQLRYELIGGNTYVMGDTDGDGASDFMIRLDGALVLTGADFSL